MLKRIYDASIGQSESRRRWRYGLVLSRGSLALLIHAAPPTGVAAQPDASEGFSRLATHIVNIGHDNRGAIAPAHYHQSSAYSAANRRSLQ